MNAHTRSVQTITESDHSRQSLPVVLLKPWVRWAARSAIVGRSRSRTDPTTGRFTREDVDQILASGLGQLRSTLPAAAARADPRKTARTSSSPP